MNPTSTCSTQEVESLFSLIDASPTPWHLASELIDRFQTAGFILLDEREEWSLTEGERYCVVRYGAPVAAFQYPGVDALNRSGFRILAAHIDSPGLRIKPNSLHPVERGVGRLGVEIYGSPILATFTDRDLSLAGRVWGRRSGAGDHAALESHLIQFDDPILRIPNAAIHLNRGVNEKGLLLDKHSQIVPLIPVEDPFQVGSKLNSYLADKIGESVDEVLDYELLVYDTQQAAFTGADREWFSASRIDNQASCHAIYQALSETQTSETAPLALFFDHEEVGSVSAAGAAGNFAESVIERVCHASGIEVDAQHALRAKSLMLSVDMAHAYHPGYSASYDADHLLHLNGGPAIKYNASQRYATDAYTASLFATCCELAAVPYQRFVNRADLPCGSTVGPTLAAQLGIRSADVGNPMWAMHSIRETAGTQDHRYLIEALKRFLVISE